MTPDVPRCPSTSPRAGLKCARPAGHWHGPHRTAAGLEWADEERAVADPSP